MGREGWTVWFQDVVVDQDDGFGSLGCEGDSRAWRWVGEACRLVGLVAGLMEGCEILYTRPKGGNSWNSGIAGSGVSISQPGGLGGLSFPSGFLGGGFIWYFGNLEFSLNFCWAEPSAYLSGLV